MLKLDFLNVGDGDAILIRDDAVNFVMLVDTGRPHIEFTKGSKRTSVINHLMRERIDHIDLLVLTHLHFDHIGGTLSVLRHIPVRRLLAVYLPPEGAPWIDSSVSEEKTIVGLCDALNLYADIVSAARSSGTTCEIASRTAKKLTPQLTMLPVLPDKALVRRQKKQFDAIFRGEPMTEDVLYAISKERNISSLRLRLTYADKTVLLAGDSYAAYWENDPEEPCDILKVPHHGDEKSMTQILLDRLKPEYAVISCENVESPKKERPAKFVLEMLLNGVPRVLCTENRSFEGYPATTQTVVRLEIHPDGAIFHRA
ncbi:MAG TPA: MBL fold metallo-hydrolase [Candidatus Cryosericum sp.]|nr:MBL fold metallo-hydrolase [Candidatus Cryosericum sp.]